MSDIPLLFDRRLVRQHRDRAARGFAAHDALIRETAERLKERLDDVRRDFSSVLLLGSRDDVLAETLRRKNPASLIVSADLSPAFAHRAHGITAVADEEILPFAAHSFDLILSNFALHWVNDLPGALVQIRKCLKPEGLFLAAMPGGATLQELRASLLQAEITISGGASPRLSPSADLRDMAGLVHRAGFILPVADSDKLTLLYPDMLSLMHDLRGMGENHAGLARLRHPTRRQIFLEAAQFYKENFAEPNGKHPATFDIIFLHGWAP